MVTSQESRVRPIEASPLRNLHEAPKVRVLCEKIILDVVSFLTEWLTGMLP